MTPDWKLSLESAQLTPLNWLVVARAYGAPSRTGMSNSAWVFLTPLTVGAWRFVPRSRPQPLPPQKGLSLTGAGDSKGMARSRSVAVRSVLCALLACVGGCSGKRGTSGPPRGSGGEGAAERAARLRAEAPGGRRRRRDGRLGGGRFSGKWRAARGRWKHLERRPRRVDRSRDRRRRGHGRCYGNSGRYGSGGRRGAGAGGAARVARVAGPQRPSSRAASTGRPP